MHTDLPLEESKYDKLGRYLFATEIASGLVNSFKNNNESIVLGINGAWGSGKSTIINFIINEVKRLTNENEEEIITVRFNPWMFSGQKELQNIFLKELFIKLETNKEKLKDASKKIADFLEHLNWLKYIHSGTGEAVSDAQKFLQGLSKEKNLSELKSDIDDLLIKSKVKLYITIDDIDRLTPSEITDIFQLVKLNGNFANTIFILAYDHDVVTTALNQQFGENGKKYIEKIVQIDYTLPSVSKEDITRIFIDSINTLFPSGEICEIIKSQSDEIKTEPFIKYFKSLRDIYRYNNSIKLRLSSIFNDLNLLDFLSIEALRIFNQKAYQFVIDNKENLIYQKSVTNYNFRMGSNDENSAKDIIEKTEFDITTKNILNRLFLIDTMLSFNTESPEDLIRAKRVANKNYFDRYFNLQLANFDIQEETFDKFINSTETQTNIEILKDINEKNQLFQFLNWVEIKNNKSKKEQQKNILLSALGFTNLMTYKRQGLFGYDSDIMSVLRFCSKILNDIEDLEERRKIISEHLVKIQKEIHFSSFYVADTIMNSKELLDKEKLYSDYLWYDLFKREKEDDDLYIKDLIEKRNISAKQLFTKLLEDKDFLGEDEITLILGVVKNSFPEYYDENFPKLIVNDNELIKYLWLSIKKNWMTSNSNTGYQLAEYQFFPGLDKEKIKERIDKFDLDLFDENENKVIALFNKAYNDGFKENKYYNIETLEDMGRY
ncbi:KAP family P-loop NTPase fold protein [Winogradskyella bathintestinalis]|uniref:P-loop NTPase fold protein n=1 Tax=Winogradskyella bathintestinalis TaxID=3035208 RepID=A0ABT7ZZE1_9FLAO|nr:P-loop NTPase fold protein [Winogradskyella bathintestinalis]MDN3494261.1 P-loop NTPase fold protein [Winogradskyella bathintestinalis]